MDKLLQLDPNKRPSASSALNHPWLINVNPDRISPPMLPKNLDCHELWSKKMRSNRNKSGSNTASSSGINSSNSNGHSSYHQQLSTSQNQV